MAEWKKVPKKSNFEYNPETLEVKAIYSLHNTAGVVIRSFEKRVATEKRGRYVFFKAGGEEVNLTRLIAKEKRKKK